MDIEDSRVVAVCRPSKTKNLIVYFNGINGKAYGRPEKPFSTNFESYTTVIQYDAHAIWIAEETPTWYLGRQAIILSILKTYILDNGISAVKLVGSSAGGYAAIRYGMLLDKSLRQAGFDAIILSYGINPQTGFRPQLLRKIKRAIAVQGWDSGAFGTDPLFLPPALYERFQPLVVDLSELLRGYEPANFGIVLVNDDSNPIERVFCADIANLGYVVHLKHHFKLGHGEGCKTIKLGPFWPLFDIASPFGVVKTAQPDLIPLHFIKPRECLEPAPFEG